MICTGGKSVVWNSDDSVLSVRSNRVDAVILHVPSWTV